MEQNNSTSDMACLASQFPRLVGLAQASQVYRDNPELAKSKPGFTMEVLKLHLLQLEILLVLKVIFGKQ